MFFTKISKYKTQLDDQLVHPEGDGTQSALLQAGAHESETSQDPPGCLGALLQAGADGSGTSQDPPVGLAGWLQWQLVQAAGSRVVRRR